MILVWLLAIPLGAGLLAWLLGRRAPLAARWVSLAALAVDLALALRLWAQHPALDLRRGWWLAGIARPWIPALGVRFELAADGLSLLLVVLTLTLGLLAVLASWSEVRERVGFFHFNLLWILTGVLGVFLALDLFLFYVFWELMLVPMYYLIGIWGHEDRVRAALKFFLFTQASGLAMLVSIVALGFVHRALTGRFSLDYLSLLRVGVPLPLQAPLLLGFALAFAVKLPVVPLHTWLPDAHTEAPTGGSVILAGLLLKTGAYGFLRFAIPLFPEAARSFAPIAVWLGVAGILYGAVLAAGQRDLKRLVAYSSVSHLGFVLLGIFSFDERATQGAVLELICHGFSTGGLFLLVGMLQERTGTRDLDRLGGLFSVTPRLGQAATVLALATLGLPGLGNFAAELLILLGAFRGHPVAVALASAGLVAAMIYALRLLQGAFHGPNREGWRLADLRPREGLMLLAVVAVLLWLGLAPQPVLDRSAPFAALFARPALGLRLPGAGR